MTPLPAGKSKCISKYSILNPRCPVANSPQGLSKIDNDSFTTWGKVLQTYRCGLFYVTGQCSLFGEFLSILLCSPTKHFILRGKTKLISGNIYKTITSKPPIQTLQRVYNQLKIPRSWILNKHKSHYLLII